MIDDYQAFLNEYGLTESYVHSLVQNESDQIPMPEGFEHIFVNFSEIEGLGLFTLCPYKSGQMIAPARINGFRTPAGRFTNHSSTPNAIFAVNDFNDLVLIAIKPISVNEEITIDYRQAMEINGSGFEKIYNFLDIPKAHGIDISSMSNREKIDVIEWIIMNKMENIVDYLKITNYINGGVYAREMKAPAGIVITGKIHEHDHINILSEGEISVMTDDGMKRVKAPYTFESKAGIRRIGYTHSDITWTSIHSVINDNINEIEKELFTTPNIDWVSDLFKSDIEVLT
jgi:hypothetical protein